MANRFLTLFRMASFFVAACAAMPPAPAQTVSADEASIRMARQALNTAIEKRDIERYAAYWTANPEVIWASANGLVAGRDANIARTAKAFQNPGFLYGVRTPVIVQVNQEDGAGAAETGTWRWAYHRGGKDIEYQGRYLVGWRKVDGSWKVQSELYVQTGCKPSCS
ncbi:nuclear transport factor 2 family protein [Dyella amyloliquefaciens]|uniref:nuclear transport factor 2 family protein n=1 Tax=Dyella amyloliquefaciens TaxID=1770545 RepID=UPI00102E38B9|nr:nuclear transport factor 2 family protein [Dyella amyloliquefaciens]